MDADGSIAHVLVVGDVAKALKISPEEMDAIGGSDARVTRTVLRSEVLRILISGPLDLIITASGAAFLASAEFLAAFAARVIPVSMLMLAQRPDEELLLRLREGGVVPEPMPLPVAYEALRERVRGLLRQRRLGSTTTREPLVRLVRRIQGERGTYTLHVNAGTEYGSITFVDGVLVDAQNARRTGERAALDILGWRHTSAVLDRIVPHTPPTVTTGLSALLVEVERAALARPPPEAIAAPPPAASEEILTRGATETPKIVQPSKRDNRRNGDSMANINKTLEETMKIDGAIGAAIADWDSDTVWEVLGYCASGMVRCYSDHKELLDVYAAAGGTSCAVSLCARFVRCCRTLPARHRGNSHALEAFCCARPALRDPLRGV